MVARAHAPEATRARSVPPRRRIAGLISLLLTIALAAACGAGEAQDAGPEEDADEPGAQALDEDAPPAPGDMEDEAGPLTVYSGRTEDLVGPLLDRFTTATGIETEVRYGDTAELAATILEEGAGSPADVYIAQDAGALGALRDDGMLATLPDELLEPVDPRFRAADDTWVGLSGRARTLVYSTDLLERDEVPDSVLDLVDERWEGRVGWAPTNGSFQAFITATRTELGEEATRGWLEGMIANGTRVYEGNAPIVEAVGRGEIELGLVNHYYLYRFLAEEPGFAADNAFLDGGDVGALVNVAGAGVLATTDKPRAAEQLVAFALSDEAQRYFSEETFEYPLVIGIPADDRLPPLETIETPDVDLSELADLQRTLELLREVGALR